MKVKLLKKIRKRFVIEHFPNGFVGKYGRPYNHNLFRLADTSNIFLASSSPEDDRLGFSTKWVCLNPSANFRVDIGGILGNVLAFKTSKECIDYLKQDIVQILRNEGYRGRKDKPGYRPVNKVWYNK